MYLAGIVLLPFFSTLIAAVLPDDTRNREAWLSGLTALLCFTLVALKTPEIMSGAVIVERYNWIPALDLVFTFRMDGFSYIFALLVSGMGALISLYARYYMDPADPRPRFYAFFLIFMGAMLGLVLSGNVIQMVIFWELTSMASFMLIAYWFHRADARRGARISFTVTATGGFALLASVLIMGYVVGSYDLETILNSGDHLRNSPYYPVIVITFALGCLTKSAQFPFHFWLPNAMAAPTPVSAYLHSATLVKVGVFALARFWVVLSGTDLWFFVISGAGLISFVIGAYNAFFQKDMKGILAYSTISHLGLICTLLGMNSRLALVVAIFHMLNHATFKASLFMATGIVDHETGTRDITILNGLRKAMPVTALLAAVAAAAMAGVPLLNGFISKEMFFSETLFAESSFSSPYFLPIMAVIGSILSVAYSYRFIVSVFFGEPHFEQLPKKPHDPQKLMLVPSAILVFLCVLVGVLPQHTIGPFLNTAVSGILGLNHGVEYDLALWHGLNIPLLMSVLALIGGVSLALIMHRSLLAYPDVTPLTERFEGRRIFDKLMDHLDIFAYHTVRWTSSERMQIQLVLVVLISIVVAALPLVGRYDVPRPNLMQINWLFFAMWIVGCLGAVLTAYHAQYNRFRAIIFASATGIVVVVTFAWLSAPDLALTQLVVEVVTCVLLLLGLRWLPKPKKRQSELEEDPVLALRRRRDLIIALSAGIGMSLLAYFLMMRPTNRNDIGDMILVKSLPEGHGTNAVNVTLVDFRGFDTFGEITVLGIVALTVYALLRRFRPPQEMLHALDVVREELTTDLRRIKEDGKLPKGTMLVPNVIGRLLMPVTSLIAFYFFFRGHNLPGGGFVAGLIFATGVITQFIISGMLWVESKSRIRPQNWLAVGLLLAVGAGALPMLFGLPFLSAMVWEPVLPFYGKLHFSTVLIFDLGVFALVVGTTTYMLVALAHQSLRFYRKNIQADPIVDQSLSPTAKKLAKSINKNQ
ncbi:NAD(P)H-quinone oxidoreductase subunit 2, chloroplastic [Oligella sp. MSHR50489EDL]|uniref:monovalent cation/H+ antiporter subunit A n=1 Tax=Oligella sp. MSHR50489EDL TaxID=3139409 RepID=UPI003D816029